MISEKAIKLILEYEGLDQPSEWPGGNSGITIGVGYDLGYEDNFEEDWSEYLTLEEIDRLKSVLGLKGDRAKQQAHKFKDIRVSRVSAEKVFLTATIPRYVEEAGNTFPGFDDLPLDVQGALVSLVFNRGSSMDGDRRSEMRAIREAVLIGDLKGIANQLRLMKRLWVGKGVDGLLRRRDAEADLVESCLQSESTELIEELLSPIAVDLKTSILDAIVLVIKKLIRR